MSTEEGTIVRKRSFAQVPDDLVTDTRISANAVRVWARLDRYAGHDGRAFPSRERLAADLGLSVRNVARALAELVDGGWISREGRDGKSALTRLHDRSTRAAGGTAPVPPVAHPRATGGTRPVPPVAHEGEVLKETHLRTSSADAAAADAADGEELDLGIDTPARTPNPVQVLVGAYVEEVKRRGGTATRARIGRVGRDVKRLLADGITEPVLLAAVVQAATRGRADIDGILAAPNGPQNAGRAERDRMFARWEEIAEQFDRRQQP